MYSGLNREFGKAQVRRIEGYESSPLEGLTEELQMWISHADKLSKVLTGFTKIGGTSNSDFVSIKNPSKKYTACNSTRK